MSEAEPKRGGCMRLIWRAFVVAFVLVMLTGIAGVVAGYLVYDQVTQPGVPGPDVEFDVPAGATGAQVGRLLTDAGLIDNPWFFRFALRIDQPREPIKHGAYMLHKGMSPGEIVDQLQEGPNRKLRPDEIPDELKKTIPEGLRISQIAELFDDPDAFLDAVVDPSVIAYLPEGVESPEGFLLPDTYFFETPPTPRDVAKRMAAAFAETYAQLLKEYPDAADRDPLEVVTVASLVEEEARVDEERPIVAAVIYNRLKLHRPLELDSTLQYALNKYGQRLLNEDKEVESPYNTYRNNGLPPGPISNPGIASLRAAMHPADVDYLYFVSNADGKTHTFSRTIEEHNRAVAKYRREIRKQRREQTESQ